MRHVKWAPVLALLIAGLVGAPALAGVFDAPGNPRPIPDVGTSGSLVSTIIIDIDEEVCPIADLNVIVEMSHTFAGDLELTLTHVDTGTSVKFVDNHGGGADYGGEYIFDDEAGVPLSVVPGTYTPELPLDAFDGESINGTWDLTIDDIFEGDSGTLSRFALELEVEECTPTAIFSPSANKYAVTPSGLVALKQANGYALELETGEIDLVFDGLALGIHNLDCIHRQDTGLFVFSTSTNKAISTPDGFVNLNAGNAYRLEADGTITLVIDAVLIGGVDACQIVSGIPD